MGKGTSLLIRSALWIVLAMGFLVRDIFRIAAAHSAGKPVTVWMAVQLVLWLAVLGFWSYAAWRGWKSRALEPKIS